MKKILFAACVLAGLSHAPAVAADMPAPVYKAPPYIAPQANWSGFYLGGHAGYDWGRTRVLDNGVLAESGAPTNGVIGGLVLGYNWQGGPVVYGLEFDIGAAGLRGTGNVLPPPPPPPPNQYAVNWAGNFRGRAGYLIFPETLIFVAGGLAFAEFKFTHGGTGNSFTSIFPGWTIGGGIERMFTPNFIGRIEYLYADYGNKTYEVQPADFYNAAFTSQILRGALIWKF